MFKIGHFKSCHPFYLVCLSPLMFAPVSALAGSPSWSDVIAESGWTQISTRDHKDAGTIQVYKKTVSGTACFKGRATTDLDPQVMLEVAIDIPGTVRWSSAGVAEGEILSQSGTNIDYYQYLDVPGWTFSSDRFWFLTGVIEQSGDTTMFHWDRLVNGGPHAQRYNQVKAAHPDAIEPPVNVGGWQFTTTGASTLIQYYICTDTGGSIPAMVQNAATTRTLPDSVGDLVREARKR